MNNRIAFVLLPLALCLPAPAHAQTPPAASPIAAASPATATITSFSPTVGKKGSLVQIKGSGLKSVSTVAFHGVPAQFTINSDTLLTALVPATTSGPISVTTPSGRIHSAAPFTVGKMETAIAGIIPASGAAGTLVQISGIGFTNATGVKFGGVPCRFLVVSDALMTVTVPKGAKSGLVTVITPAGPAHSPIAFK